MLFFVREKLGDGITVLFGFAGRREDTLLLQSGCNLSQTDPGKIPLENPTDDFASVSLMISSASGIVS